MALTKQVPVEDPVVRYEKAKTLVAGFQKQRAEKLALLEMYKNQYNDILRRAKELGVDDINSLQTIIASKKDEIAQLVAAMEEKLQTAEQILNANQ